MFTYMIVIIFALLANHTYMVVVSLAHSHSTKIHMVASKKVECMKIVTVKITTVYGYTALVIPRSMIVKYQLCHN